MRPDAETSHSPRFDDRQEGGDGRDRDRPLRLRDRPHDRQPADLPRPARDQRVRPSSCASSSMAAGSGSPGPASSPRSAFHIWAATSLTLANRRRAAGRLPRGTHRIESTYASRTMVWSGPILALFIVYHLAHLTLGAVTPGFVEGDVYHNLIAGFQPRPRLGLLHPGHARAGPAPLPRGLEHAPDPGLQPPALERLRAPRRGRGRAWSWWSATSRSRWRSSRW